MKKYSASLIIREIEIKTNIKYFHLPDLALKKKEEEEKIDSVNSCWQG